MKRQQVTEPQAGKHYAFTGTFWNNEGNPVQLQNALVRVDWDPFGLWMSPVQGTPTSEMKDISAWYQARLKEGE